MEALLRFLVTFKLQYNHSAWNTMGFPAADALKRHLTEAKERNVWTNASTAQP